MNLERIHKVYLFGIGGIGMSALARYFHQLGMDVAGYDRTPSPLIDSLMAEGIEVSYDSSINAIPEIYAEAAPHELLVIYTPAVPNRLESLIYLREKGFPTLKRSEALSAILEGKRTFAVAGTHGKTTTTSLVAHLLNFGNHEATAFLGGIATNFNSNLVVSRSSEIAVVEADEYDRSFLRLKPEVSVITSTEADHLDIYGDAQNLTEGFRQFARLTPINGLLIVREGIEISSEAPVWTYAVESETATLTTKELRVEDGAYRFQLWFKGDFLGEVTMHYPGRHNVENALAATAMAIHAGLNTEEIIAALKTFSGVKRRFEYQIRKDDLVFIDDYAHHPTEIDACVNSARELYPEKRITGVFQPHLYSRTRDFADDFATSLESLNDLLLMEIYPAREEPIEGVSSQKLLDKVRLMNKKLVEREELVEEVLKLDPEVLLTMGAGDIDRMIEPLKNALDEEDE